MIIDAHILAELQQMGDDLDLIARRLTKEERAQLPELEEALRAHLDIRNAILEALGRKPDPVP